MGEFEAVAEGSTGSENGIPQAQRANFYAEVNGASGAHFVQKDSTKLVSLRAESRIRSTSDYCLVVGGKSGTRFARAQAR